VVELNEKAEVPSLAIRILHFFATPFSYETGFYFQGKKTYHMNGCGILTIAGLIFLIASVFVLFWPVLSGKTIYSKLETIPFSTPADIPINSSIPGGLS
jgi:glycopeptide antibiotics resistance protein